MAGAGAATGSGTTWNSPDNIDGIELSRVLEPWIRDSIRRDDRRNLGARRARLRPG
jgi:hypothetical protein